MKCPMCGKGEVVCVGPWASRINQFGLAFNMKDGRTCCSMNNRFRGSREAVQELADTKTLEQWAADEGLSGDEDGPLD